MFILVIVAYEAFLISVYFLGRVLVSGAECHVQSCGK